MINREILAGIAGLHYRNCITVAYLLYSAHLLTVWHYVPLSSVQASRTPLFYASWKGHVAVVQLLLQNNADVSICKAVYTYVYIQ